MNEQQNAALIQKIYDAFGRGDIQTILASVAADAEWSFEAPANVPFGGKRRGPQQILGFFQGLADRADELKLSAGPIIAQGDHVSMMGRFSAKVRATGIRYDVPVAHFFTIRDGQVGQFTLVSDTSTLSAAYGAAAASSR